MSYFGKCFQYSGGCSAAKQAVDETLASVYSLSLPEQWWHCNIQRGRLLGSMTGNRRSGQARPARQCRGFGANGQNDPSLYDTNLNQVTSCTAKLDETFAVDHEGCVSQQHQSIVSSLCTCTTLKVSIPSQHVGGLFDRFQRGTIVKYVEPPVLAVVWEYFGTNFE